MQKLETKARSRLKILNFVMQFCLAKTFSSGEPWPPDKDFSFRPSRTPAVGSLVALTAAPQSKWYLSWVHSVERPEGWCDDNYCLESIEDGELCNWTNVAFYEFPQENMHQDWRWTDAQHAFNDRWSAACYTVRDAYIILPIQPVFDANGGVTLGTRVRHSMRDARPTRHFPNWKKCTKAMMLEFYDWAVVESEPVKADNSQPAT